MTIEEKAKAYDEAIKVARSKIENDKDHILYERDITDIFPILKESEDEKIRKALIDYFDDANKADENPLQSYGIHTDKAIAWLEKQGERQTPQNNERAWLYLVADVLTWREGIGQYLDNPKVQELAKKLQKEYGQKLYIEEQGNPTDINPSEFDLRLNKLLKQFETLPKEELVSSLSFYLNVVQNDGTYREEKQGEQKPIWTDNDRTMAFTLLRDVDQMTYISKEGKNERLQWLNSLEEKFTRKEKPADKIEDEEYNGEDYGIDSLFHAQRILEKTLGSVGGYQTDDGILAHQCAISAVKKLYEQKPVSITDEWIEDYWQHEKVNNPYSYDKGEEIQFDHQGFVRFCKKYCKKPAEWSEEDEYMLDETIQHLKQLIRIDKAKHCACDVQYYQRDIDWLKSLRPQKQWKPTEAQLASLTIACDRNDRIGFDLTQLLKELKKL